jgi:DNA-binding NarL/FixJ family response regulator
MKQTRILIIDDHPLVREGLMELLRQSLSFIAFSEAAGANEALPLLRLKWDLVLLDISLPDEDGFQFLSKIKHLQPNLPVLVVSMHPEEYYAVRALKAGAAGFISKAEACETLSKAVETVLDGRIYISDIVAEQLAQDVSCDSHGPADRILSTRELQVMKCLGAGRSVKEISFDLRLSAKTISSYRARVLNKLRLSTTSDVIRYAIREGIVPV